MRFILMAGLCLFTSASSALMLNDFCKLDVEGTYSGKLGKLNGRINVICVDGDRVVASVYPDFGVKGIETLESVANLTRLYLDGPEMIFADFDADGPDRRGGSSKSLNFYLRIDAAQLLAEHITGTYMGGNMAAEQDVDMKRIQTYPKLTATPRVSLMRDAVAGSFATHSSYGDSTLIFDILAGTPIVYLRDSMTGTSWRFTDGAAWDGTGTFSLSVPQGNGGEPDDRKLFYVRGRFLNDKTIEFYLVSPARGLDGPLLAKKL
jgi:hypothetical protein